MLDEALKAMGDCDLILFLAPVTDSLKYYEDFLEKNIEVLESDEDNQLMIIGKQVRSYTNKRTDLVAIDASGRIVIVEIKRDEQDMKNRKDNFESQAIRYAATFATVDSVEDIVKKVYSGYLMRSENIATKEEAEEEGKKRIESFLTTHETLEQFNNEQRIILVASEFDEDTMSSSAWLLSHGINISCIRVSPYKTKTEHGDDYLFEIRRILPLGLLEDFYTGVRGESTRTSRNRGTRRQRTFPRLKDMIEANIVQEGDEVYFKGREDETLSIIHNDGRIEYNGTLCTLNEWAKKFITTPSGTNNAYLSTVVKKYDKTLADLRKENYDKLSGNGSNTEEF